DVHTELTLSRAVGGAVSVQLKSWQAKVILKSASQKQIDRNISALTDLCRAKGAQLPPLFELQFLAMVMCQYTGDTTRMFDRVKAFLLSNIALLTVRTRQATTWNDDSSFIQTLDRVTNSAKWQCPVITHGYTSIPGRPLFQVPLTHAQQIQRGPLSGPTDDAKTFRRRDEYPAIGRAPDHLCIDRGIAGMDIFDVPLCKVVSGAQENWALRQVAHGRTVQWENFRSRQEAIFCGVLTWALRSDQAEQEGTDFVTVLNASQKKFFPEADIHDWNARYNTIKKLADDLVRDLRKKAPVSTNQTLLMRLQTLESENARLEGQSSRPSQPEPRQAQRKGRSRPRPRSAPVAMPVKEKQPEHQDDADAAAFGSAPPILEGDVESPSVEDEREPGPAAPEDTYAQHLPQSGSVRFLENCNLPGTSMKHINSWLASTALGKGKNKAIDTAVAEFLAACAKIDDGYKKPAVRIAVEWGLSVTTAAKLSEVCLTRLIAGAYLLASGALHSTEEEEATICRHISPLVFIKSPCALPSFATQNSRQIHVGSILHFFMCFDIHFFALLFQDFLSHSGFDDSGSCGVSMGMAPTGPELLISSDSSLNLGKDIILQ
ncbi:unnamed protein product, partial [Symbiodinium sp. CCMP2456]